MKYSQLGNTGLQVSRICLGTMTWGEQNTEAEAHEQLDIAVDRGVNFIDTAEMYPVPPKAETQGRTEEYLGSWLKQRGDRDRLVIASKVAGNSKGFEWIRGGPALNREQILQAADDSLQRLQTDYIDLYQVHWPARPANYFGKLGYERDDVDDDALAGIEETLAALAELIAAGKVRHVGVSNETPWGLMQYLRLSEQAVLPRPVSIQNPYNLLNRSFEVGLAEIALRESVGLLAYSPLAFGVLSGKYAGGAQPEGARMTLFPRFSRYSGDTAMRASEEYVSLAYENDLSPVHMAQAFVNSRPFLTSNIIGATSREQLEENLDSIDVTLDQDVLDAINDIHETMPNPAP
ncbi:MAG: NADP(H)-dependent aldo-keto reductase [Halofilum sp. (in: g-proteobacteria)]|nr:NADP(H)-dependent aldo-keto reductase [Halofilum sp. (in: g-proteobacteria)]